LSPDLTRPAFSLLHRSGADCERIVGTAYVTDDVGLVLQIAKHFGETGGPLPEARWEPH
jgi:hypothetical protein